MATLTSKGSPLPAWTDETGYIWLEKGHPKRSKLIIKFDTLGTPKKQFVLGLTDVDVKNIKEFIAIMEKGEKKADAKEKW